MKPQHLIHNEYPLRNPFIAFSETSKKVLLTKPPSNRYVATEMTALPAPGRTVTPRSKGAGRRVTEFTRCSTG